MRREEPHGNEGRRGLGLGRVIQDHGPSTRRVIALLSIALWGPLTVSQLAGRQRVLVKTASLVAVELEQAGLIERVEDPADRRRTIVSVAGSKEQLIGEALRKQAAPLRRPLDRLAPAQRDALIVGLESLVREMSGQA